jgi:hypothetical protein
MSIAGVYAPIIDLAITLPTARSDGTSLALSEIESVTILRDSGGVPQELKVLSGPFTGPIRYSDTAPVPGEEAYSFYVTDTAGVRGKTSAAVVVKAATPVKAPPKEGTLTAVAKASGPIADVKG